MKKGIDIFETVKNEYDELFRHMISLNRKIEELNSESSIDAVLEIAHDYEAIRDKAFELQELYES